MDITLALSLAALALIDSLSIGTLLIPLFLLLDPGGVRAGRVLLYLATIAGFYLLVGVLATAGLLSVADSVSAALSSPSGLTAQLVVGVALLVGSFFIGRKKDSAGGAPGGRLSRWRGTLLSPRAPAAAIAGVALAAGLLEVATMLPYLAAMGLMAEAGLEPGIRMAVLAGYCLVMVLPAVLLLALRLVARRLVEPPLARLADWLHRTGGETTAWIVGIVGFLVARSAASELGLLDRLGFLS